MVPVSSVVSPAQAQRLFLPAIVSGLLLFTTYFPLSLGFLAWIALVPFFTLIRAQARPRRLYFAAFVGGLAFYLPAIQWMRVAHPAMYGTWLALALYCALFFPVGLWLIRVQDRARIPLVLAVPAVWVGCEYFRCHFTTGFPWLEPLGIQYRIGFGWYFLGYSQHDFLTLIQTADLTGVYGISLLIALVNVTLWLWWNRLRDVKQPRPIIATTAAVVLLAASLGYGLSRLQHPAFADGPRVALLQGNVPQDVKMTRGDELTNQYVDLWMKAILEPATPPDLTIWPETSISDNWIEYVNSQGQTLRAGFFVPPGEIVELHQALNAHYFLFLKSARYNAPLFLTGGGMSPPIQKELFWKRVRQPMLLGLNCNEIYPDEQRFLKYNSAVMLAYDRAVARYDKMHLVPFGEYVPLRHLFPFMAHFTPYKNDYSCTPGTRWTRFPLRVEEKTYNFGCIICYEDSDPPLASRYVQSSLAGPPVDFLVTISNDGWFDGTPEHEEHLAICRFRAIETRRAIVRSVNMGISGIIDSDGRIVALPAATWHASKKMEAIVTGVVPIDQRTSIYAIYGDVLPLACWFTTLSGLWIAYLRRRKRR